MAHRLAVAGTATGAFLPADVPSAAKRHVALPIAASINGQRAEVLPSAKVTKPQLRIENGPSDRNRVLRGTSRGLKGRLARIGYRKICSLAATR